MPSRHGGADAPRSARRWRSLAAWAAALSSVACYGVVEGTIVPVGEKASAGSAGGSGPSGAGATGGTAPGSAGSFCEVSALLAARCVSCHSDPLPRGVPMTLTAPADLTAPSSNDPARSVIDVSIERLRDPEAPMPPAPANPPTSAEADILEAWVQNGMPADCDSGTAGSGGVVGNPYDTPVTCTSDRYWTQGNEGSRSMRPGGECIDCHDNGPKDGPPFALAGTVYPSAHEPNDCDGANGTSTSAEVIVIDANGKTFTMAVNPVGNFYYETEEPFAFPYRAKVVSEGRERLMAGEQTTGDCNGCHTESGAEDAPGRIVLP